ncbi:hypothetical protein [Kistimonas asteriae]|nr:hypothetical protein [Kistimonas asteriae]
MKKAFYGNHTPEIVKYGNLGAPEKVKKRAANATKENCRLQRHAGIDKDQ